MNLSIWGGVWIVFDNTFVLLRSVNTVSVVIFCAADFGMFVNNSAIPVLLAVNPRGKDVVFITDPSGECTFITALISLPTRVGSDTE